MRENRKGELYSLVYGNPCALHLDLIEMKPFFHVLPSTSSFSIATVGCNFQCGCCQSWQISQASPEDVYSCEVPPEMVVAKAREMGVRSVAYAYVEPAVFNEYALDTAHLVKKAGLLNVIHSNGFINRVSLEELCKVLDAANIDLKGFTDKFYQEFSGGYLCPMLETLKTLRSEKVHLEITNLIIPTKNDEMPVVREMCRWIRKELGADTSIHFSRFYPLYKLTDLPPTPVSTLEKARSATLAEGLKYVYIANVRGHESENTFRPEWIDFDRGIRMGNLESHERITQILKYNLERRFNTAFVIDRWGRGVYWQWIYWLPKANRQAKPISNGVNFGCAKLFISVDREQRIFRSGLQVERGHTGETSPYPGTLLQEDWDWHRLIRASGRGSPLDEELRRLLMNEGFIAEVGDWVHNLVLDRKNFSSAAQLKTASRKIPAEHWGGFQLYYPMPEGEVHSCSGYELVKAILAVFCEVTSVMNLCMQVPLAAAEKLPPIGT